MVRSAFTGLALAALVAVPSTAFAFDFELGSDGSYGPIDITVDTELQLPPDGVFHATTIDIAAGATLTFAKNTENTGVVLLATGDVNIAGTIDVSGFDAVGAAGGIGGPGGTNGGGGYLDVDALARSAWLPVLDRNDIWSFATGGDGGRGGGGSVCGTAGGGGGGGGLALVSNTALRASPNAEILARGGRGGSCVTTSQAATDGVGGRVWLTAPEFDLADLTVDTNSGDFFLQSSGYVSREYIVGTLPTVAGSNVETHNRLTAWRPNPVTLVEIVSIDGLPLDTNGDVQLTGAGRSVDIAIRVVGCTGSNLTANATGIYIYGTSAPNSIPGPALSGDDTITVTTGTLHQGQVYLFRPEALCEF